MFPIWASIGVACHWLAMTLWLSVIDNTKFCGNSRLIEITFSATVGLVYIFNFISLKEGPTRKYYLGYYPVCFFENIAAITIWGVLSHKSLNRDWYYYPLIVIPIISFLLGMIFLVIYYHYLHPNKFGVAISTQTDTRNEIMYKDDENVCNGMKTGLKGEGERMLKVEENNDKSLLQQEVEVKTDTIES